MMDNLEYIDRFFKGELSPEESVTFEQRILNDPVFAEEVAFYASALQTIKNDLAEEKKKRFREIYQLGNHHAAAMRPIRKLWPYIAAAAVVIGVVLVSYLLYFRTSTSSPQQFADTYIKEQLGTVSVTMSGNQDSLQKGKNFYNEGKLMEALQQFEDLVRSDTSDTEAKKLAGLSCLRLLQYDKAITYFEKLERITLYSNSGKFYHALTLMKRNLPGDDQKARKLLQEVVENDLHEKETARKWLERRW